MVLQNLYMHAPRIILAQMRSDLDLAVGHGIVLDKSADETDDDDRRRRKSIGCTDRACRIGMSGGSDEGKDKGNTTD